MCKEKRKTKLRIKIQKKKTKKGLKKCRIEKYKVGYRKTWKKMTNEDERERDRYR